MVGKSGKSTRCAKAFLAEGTLEESQSALDAPAEQEGLWFGVNLGQEYSSGEGWGRREWRDTVHGEHVFPAQGPEIALEVHAENDKACTEMCDTRKFTVTIV